MERRPIPSFLRHSTSSVPNVSVPKPKINVNQSTTINIMRENMWKADLYIKFKTVISSIANILPFLALLLLIASYYEDVDKNKIRPMYLGATVTVVLLIIVWYMDKYL